MQGLPTQHRHKLDLPQGPFLRPVPVQRTHGLMDSSVFPRPSSPKDPNITTVGCSEALATQGNEPSQVLSGLLLHTVVSCASEFPQVADDACWARLHLAFRPGDKVLVCDGRTSEGVPNYDGPHEVVEVLGRYTFRLCNGQRLSARRLRKFVVLSKSTANLNQRVSRESI